MIGVSATAVSMPGDISGRSKSTFVYGSFEKPVFNELSDDSFIRSSFQYLFVKNPYMDRLCKNKVFVVGVLVEWVAQP